MKSSNINLDLARERENSKIDIEKMNTFLGQYLFGSVENHKRFMEIRNDLVQNIKPLYEENFYNLDRYEKFEKLLDKSLQIHEYIKKWKLSQEELSLFFRISVIGAVLGFEKITYFLSLTVLSCIEMWGTDEQIAYWTKVINENMVIGTYIQTEIGHGTFVRGLETTATYDKFNKAFILHSPTLTSIKFWPGTAGLTANFGIIMAKLIIDDKDYGVQAFVVQLRSFENHHLLKGIETGDIGRKFGFDSIDNGYIKKTYGFYSKHYVKFTNHRIPRFNMLMRYAYVDENGRFEKKGNEIVMYASMLVLRVHLSVAAALLLSMSITIAIRYSAVRRQTTNQEGIEPQIIDYQTQQIRLFPGLATTYAYIFASNHLAKMLNVYRESSQNFRNHDTSELNKFHAISSGLKAQSFNNCLKFAQMNRLCCGGHGYSMASGLPQVIQEADAGSTYEGDNVVLLLQTARYLIKCVQKNVQPHILQTSKSNLSCLIIQRFQFYFELFYKLYDELIREVSNKTIRLVVEQGLNEQVVWNSSSVQLLNVAKLYITIFVLECNLNAITMNKNEKNRVALADLFELFVVYEIVEVNATGFLKLNLISPKKMDDLSEQLLSLLSKIRINSVALVDSFGYLDSNLCSALGAYDGNVYEKLYSFSKNSKFNQTEVHPAYEKYMKPYILKQKSKL